MVDDVFVCTTYALSHSTFIHLALRSAFMYGGIRLWHVSVDGCLMWVSPRPPKQVAHTRHTHHQTGPWCAKPVPYTPNRFRAQCATRVPLAPDRRAPTVPNRSHSHQMLLLFVSFSLSFSPSLSLCHTLSLSPLCICQVFISPSSCLHSSLANLVIQVPTPINRQVSSDTLCMISVHSWW